jgi:hypothetical protein
MRSQLWMIWPGTAFAASHLVARPEKRSNDSQRGIGEISPSR